MIIANGDSCMVPNVTPIRCWTSGAMLTFAYPDGGAPLAAGPPAGFGLSMPGMAVAGIRASGFGVAGISMPGMVVPGFELACPCAPWIATGISGGANTNPSSPLRRLIGIEILIVVRRCSDREPEALPAAMRVASAGVNDRHVRAAIRSQE